VTGHSEYEVELEYELTDISYGEVELGCEGCMFKTVTVTPKTTLVEDQVLDTEVQSLNFEAMSSWYKLRSPPVYKSSWLYITQIVDKMNNDSFKDFYYSYFCFQSHFRIKKAVLEDELKDFSEDDQNKIYEDWRYGMKTFKSLTYWVKAHFGN
jgi:hypothetical protein